MRNNESACPVFAGPVIDCTITGQRHKATFEFTLPPAPHNSFSNRVPVTIGGKKFTLIMILQPEPLRISHEPTIK